MKTKASITNDEAIIAELRDDPQFAAEYLNAAIEDTDEPKVLLLALRQVVEALSEKAQLGKFSKREEAKLDRYLRTNAFSNGPSVKGGLPNNSANPKVPSAWRT